MGRDPVHDEAKAASQGHRQILPGDFQAASLMPDGFTHRLCIHDRLHSRSGKQPDSLISPRGSTA
jgi:hypothetical protein